MSEINTNLEVVPELQTKRVDVDLPIDLLRSARVYAAAMDLSVKAFIALCINEKVDRLNATSLIKQRVEAVRYPHPFADFTTKK